MINGSVIMTSVASVKDRWSSFSSTSESRVCFQPSPNKSLSSK